MRTVPHLCRGPLTTERVTLDMTYNISTKQKLDEFSCGDSFSYADHAPMAVM